MGESFLKGNKMRVLCIPFFKGKGAGVKSWSQADSHDSIDTYSVLHILHGIHSRPALKTVSNVQTPFTKIFIVLHRFA